MHAYSGEVEPVPPTDGQPNVQLRSGQSIRASSLHDPLVLNRFIMRESQHSRKGMHIDALLDVLLVREDTILGTTTIKVLDWVWGIAAEWKLGESDGVGLIDAYPF
jgi:hypothetical protein